MVHTPHNLNWGWVEGLFGWGVVVLNIRYYRFYRIILLNVDRKEKEDYGVGVHEYEGGECKAKREA